ncbi:hypothetical protein Tco_0649443 [Tanacetum coccineum]
MFHLDCGSVVAIEKTGSDVVGMENEESDGDGPVNGGVGYGEVIGKLVSKKGYGVLDMAPLPPRDQRHLWLCYQVVRYTKEIVYDFEQRLETIFRGQVNRVHILDFEGLNPNMRQDLVERLRMVYTGDDGQDVFVSHAWRRLFGIRAPLVQEFILEFFSTCRIRDEMGLDAASFLTAEEMAEDEFRAYWDFLRCAPSYTYIRDLIQRLCHSMDQGATNIPYLLAQYLFRHAKGRKSGTRLSGGHFIGYLAHHFGLVSDDGLRGLSVATHEIPLIDMGELVNLNICIEIGDDWAWVASRPDRQPDVAAGALGATKDAPAVDEGAQVDPAPVQAPQPPPSPPVAGSTMPQRLGRLKEEM